MSKLLLLTACVAVFGCTTAPQQQEVPKPTVTEKQSVNIDPTLVTDCPTIPLVPTDHELTREESLQVISNLAVALSVCWHRHHDLSSVAIKAFNIDAPQGVPDVIGAPVPASTPSTTISK